MVYQRISFSTILVSSNDVFVTEYYQHCNTIGRIIWRGRLCIQDQDEYNTAVSRIIGEINHIPYLTNGCEVDPLQHSLNERLIESELNGIGI
jgi:hypothetical protein